MGSQKYSNPIELATPCRDAHVVGSYWVSNPIHLTVLAAKSEDYTTVPQHLYGGARLLSLRVGKKHTRLVFELCANNI